MLISLWFLLLASAVDAYVLQGPPQPVRLISDKLQYWATTNAKWMPDGKLFAFRENTTNPATNYMFNIPLDFRMRGPTTRLDDITAPAPGTRTDYPNRLPARDDINYVEVPNTVPIPPPSLTGARDQGQNYDYNGRWLMNAFRLSETSQPGADKNSMIGFVHNEDYWGESWAKYGCTYKSIGVRYSPDLGKSWTRSVPIITKLVQPPVSNYINVCNLRPRAQTGDLAAMWNHINKTWVIMAQEDPYKFSQDTNPSFVMSISTDPLALPGTWNRLDPFSGVTSPGLIGDNNTLLHPNLTSLPGANPSIIWDGSNKLWHMVYAKWGGGIAYTNTSDFKEWKKPVSLGVGGGYPTLIGDMGDTNTTTGNATLYYEGGGSTGLWGRPMWAVNISFNDPVLTTAKGQKVLGEMSVGKGQRVLGLDVDKEM